MLLPSTARGRDLHCLIPRDEFPRQQYRRCPRRLWKRSKIVVSTRTVPGERGCPCQSRHEAAHCLIRTGCTYVLTCPIALPFVFSIASSTVTRSPAGRMLVRRVARVRLHHAPTAARATRSPNKNTLVVGGTGISAAWPAGSSVAGSSMLCKGSQNGMGESGREGLVYGKTQGSTAKF
jgi:hypothetical protein